MKIIQLREQLDEHFTLGSEEKDALLSYLKDGQGYIRTMPRGKEESELCLSITRKESDIIVNSSYFIGVDWISESELAVQVSPKLNDDKNGVEIDYVRMLNEALRDKENFDHLQDLIEINFKSPSIPIKQHQDSLSILLVTEYLNILHRLVKKGLRKSYFTVQNNLKNKIKGRIITSKNVQKNLTKGNITNNYCSYQVYDIDSPENRILKRALLFCIRQINSYAHSKALETSFLEGKVRFIKPYFTNVSDDVDIRTIQNCKGNPVFKEYYQAIKYAQLLLKRYSYDITAIGKESIATPPFWIDMSKLFELYVFAKLREVYTAEGEIKYHVKAHYQELDYLLKPKCFKEPYVIDAKYKPRYKENGGISMDDARQVSGYARLSSIYKGLGLLDQIDELPPIKCLIIYPDQEATNHFTFTRETEPSFEKVNGYVRMYKVGLKLPVIE